MDKGVIFDMDGVLVDSEPAMRKSAILALREWGVEAVDADFIPFTGAGEDRFVGGVAELHGVRYIPEMKKRAYEIYVKIVTQELVPFYKIPETLQALHQLGYRLAVASAADLVKVEANLRAAGIDRSILSALITGEDARRKKPAPDAFLAAAARLSLAPENCVVVEDAINGIQAACSAGMKSIGITSSFTAGQLTGAGAAAAAARTCEIIPLVERLLQQ